MQNTATGFEAMKLNTTGIGNSAFGYQALVNNTTGTQNTAMGYEALSDSPTGNFNTANGYHALNRNTTGASNTAVGNDALSQNTIGNGNIAVGFGAGNKIKTGNANIDIGNEGVSGESQTIRTGKGGTQKNTYIAGINGATVAGGVGVIIDPSGHLGTVTRYKEAVHPIAEDSEAILSLKPVAFRYKKELDPDAIPQFGLVAEEVAKINPDLVANDEKGRPYTVRYDAVNAMLLNEFLKEHKKVEEQATEIAELKSALNKVTARLDSNGL
jgi:hypothetical protein